MSSSLSCHAIMQTRSYQRWLTPKMSFHFHFRLGIWPCTSLCIFPITLQKYSSAPSTGHSNLNGTLRGRNYGDHAAKIAPLCRRSSLSLRTWLPFLLSTEESCIWARFWCTFSLVSKQIMGWYVRIGRSAGALTGAIESWTSCCRHKLSLFRTTSFRSNIHHIHHKHQSSQAPDTLVPERICSFPNGYGSFRADAGHPRRFRCIYIAVRFS